jgi:hypothetical protein
MRERLALAELDAGLLGTEVRADVGMTAIETRVPEGLPVSVGWVTRLPSGVAVSATGGGRFGDGAGPLVLVGLGRNTYVRLGADHERDGEEDYRPAKDRGGGQPFAE